MFKRIAFSVVAGLCGLGAGTALGMDISLGSQLRLSAGYLGLHHDASALTPPAGFGMASYGDPTSILSYEPLYRADIALVVSGRGEKGWFDLIAGFPVAAQGTFTDRDFEAGQALHSETFSTLSMGLSGDVTLRIGLPSDVPGDRDGMAGQPYVIGSVGLERHEVRGLRCGGACPSGPFPDDIVVIGHDSVSAAAGIGLWFEHRLSERDTLDMRFEVTGGYLGVTDSHYFRPDLGPVPNIFYDFATVGGQAEIAFTHAASETVALSASAFARGMLGIGAVTFGSTASGRTGPLAAWSLGGQAGMSLSASVAF